MIQCEEQIKSPGKLLYTRTHYYVTLKHKKQKLKGEMTFFTFKTTNISVGEIILLMTLL